MLGRIIEIAQNCSYDFRATADPQDPQRYRFEEWISYYRTHWAIARVLQPETIREAGAGSGYSRLAFLDACPSARYGIDGRCSLFHIVGFHSGAGLDEAAVLRHLEQALTRADYVLIDGPLWNQLFLPVSEFLHRYRDVIEFYGALGGLNGDLLIKAKPAAAHSPAVSSSDLVHTYTSDYYLTDCGGYDAFKRSHGARLEDVRLHAVAQIARAVSGQTMPGQTMSGQKRRALDLGCGRGELSIALARAGFEVTAIDYSPAAIDLARQALQSAPEVRDRITLHCGDVNSVPLSGLYDLAVASDLIEHLTPAELDQLYSRLATHLAAGGAVVIHTYPNRWFYQYEHARKWKAAQRLGAFLPHNPRSRYEQLMHINEQSPRVLRRQLQRHFPRVLLWFGNPWEPAGNLARKFSKSELRAAPDLFAVASHQPVDPGPLLAALEMRPLHELGPGAVSVSVGRDSSPARDLQVPPGVTLPFPVTLTNHSGHELRSAPPNPVHLSYHWLSASDHHVIVFDGERTRLYPSLPPQGSEHYQLRVQAPWEPGEYLLRITLVQEGVRWFDDPPVRSWWDVKVMVDETVTEVC